MIELNERAEQFLNSIREEGERSCAAIRAETDKQVADALQAVRRTEQARADRTVKFEIERAHTQANCDLSRAHTKARTELAKKRQQLSDGIFADVRKKLTDFTATADYAAWLGSEAASLSAQLGTGAVLCARTADLPLLKKVLPAGCTAKADDSILLGGLKAQSADGRVAADDTLETRLEARRDWFLTNADLTITV